MQKLSIAALVLGLIGVVSACSDDSRSDDGASGGGGASSSSRATSTAASRGAGAAGSGGSGSGAGSFGGGGATSDGGAASGGGATTDGSGGAGGWTGTDCSVDGNPGTCMEVSACASQPGYSSTPGFCPGPDEIECCSLAPDTADNPPTPAGYKPMMDSEVTPDMTTWAVMILHDPTDYPMFSTAMKTFGSLMVLARVEWHPPDFQNNTVHRGVTLYEPD